MVFYGYLYRSCANLARSINNKSLYELLWLYGFYAALDRFPQNKQVLLMQAEVNIGCPLRFYKHNEPFVPHLEAR
jgi:hypothetical protein